MGRYPTGGPNESFKQHGSSAWRMLRFGPAHGVPVGLSPANSSPRTVGRVNSEKETELNDGDEAGKRGSRH